MQGAMMQADVVVMGGAVVIMFFLPWLDKSPVRSIRYRPDFHKYIYGIFIVSFVILGYLGIKPPSPLFENFANRRFHNIRGRVVGVLRPLFPILLFPIFALILLQVLTRF